MSLQTADRPSLVYRSALGYRIVMAGLYGRHHRARTAAVAARVPAGMSVLELCCGPGDLYERHLRPTGVSYRGLDLNPGFVAGLRRRGVDAEVRDVARPEPLPVADVVLIQAGLYHFLRDPRPLLDRMRAAARRLVIVSEPVRNLGSSGRGPVARLAARATSPGAAGVHAGRFTEASLDALMATYGDAVRERRLIPGGRDKLYVLAGAAGAGS